MKASSLISVAGAVAISMAGSMAFAQGVDLDRFGGSRSESSAPPRSLPEPPPVAPGEPPAEQTGFQVAFRTGATLPVGKISEADGDALSDVFAWQVPVLVEIGAKPINELFVGGYAGFGLGGVSSSFETQCNAAGISCSSRTLRVGIEAIVYLLPSRRIDPWFGYGIGLETTTLVAEAKKAVATQSLYGLELAHLMAGCDVRISHAVGLGPVVDFSLGRYSSFHRDTTATMGAVDDDIAHPALHVWMTLGARIVFFP